MRDEQVGQAEIFLQLFEQVYDLRGYAYVESADGLVGDDEAGTQGKGAGDSDALALASAELVRVAAQDADFESDGPHQFGGVLAQQGLAEIFMDRQRLGDDFLDSQSRVERAEGILEDDLHLAPGFAQRARAERGDCGAIEAHHSAGGLNEAQQHAAKSAFAAAGFADQSKGFALFYGEGDVVNGANGVSGRTPEGVSCVVNLR